MSYVEFFGGNYFLAWCSLWLFLMIVPIVGFVFEMFNRILRSINICIRGWPPEHLDADGDFLSCEDDGDTDADMANKQAT